MLYVVVGSHLWPEPLSVQEEIESESVCDGRGWYSS